METSKNERLSQLVAAVKYRYQKNQKEIALACGVQASYLSDMCRGRFDVSDNFLLKFCAAFPLANGRFVSEGFGMPLLDEPAAVTLEQNSSVSIPAEAWAVIRQQAASLERRDAQQDALIEMLRESFSMLKGAAVPGAAISAAADSSAG